MQRLVLILPLVGASLTSCTESGNEPQQPAAPDLVSVTAEVEARVWSFHAADTALDADALVDHFWPDFYMLVDGKRADYEDMVVGSHDILGNLDLFATEWSDLRITPLDSDHAIASFVFRDSIITNDGKLIETQGPTTLIWERRSGSWGIVYADADHYPIDPKVE